VPTPALVFPMTTCYRHPTRETGRACTRCGKPACSDCLVQASVGSHCVDCVRAARPAAPQRARQWNATHPVVLTYVIVAVNVGVYLLGSLPTGFFARTGVVQSELALFGPWVADGEWYRLVSSGFTHAGILHLAMNMLFIWQAGLLLEPALGRVRFALLYFASLLCGSAGALLVSPNALTVGASGAAFGMLGAAVVGLRMRGVPVMRTNLGTLLVLNLGITFLVPGISIGGHLGGLVGGTLVGAVLLRPRIQGVTPPRWDPLVPVVVGAVAVAVSLATVAV
jgi:membrane associated rhomboid family serine protease